MSGLSGGSGLLSGLSAAQMALLTGLAPVTKNADYTFTSADVGSLFLHTNSTAYSWTIDTYAHDPIASGQVIAGSNTSTGTLTIVAPTGGSLVRTDGTAGTGNRTVGAASDFVLTKIDNANAWKISGSAIT